MHVPGKDHHVPDAMSWSQVETPKGDESWRPWEASRKCSCRSSAAKDTEDLETTTKAGIVAAVSWALEDLAAPPGCDCKGSSDCGRCRPAGELPHGSVYAATTNPKLLGPKEIDKTSSLDPTLKELRQMVESGASADSKDWQRHLWSHNIKDADYTVVGDMGLVNGRVVVPEALRSEMLAALHRSHGGMVGMQARAREALFWPGMTNDIQRTRDECGTCCRITPSQAATPPKPLPVLDYPFQMMSSNHFKTKWQHYLAMVYRYSGWLSV